MIFLILFLFAATAEAKTLEVRDLDLYWKQYDQGSRELLIDSELPGREIDQELELVWNVDLFDSWLYFDNEIVGQTVRDIETQETEQFRTVSWHATAGFRILNFLYLEREHLSRHLLDQAGERRFPARDSWNIRVRFIP